MDIIKLSVDDHDTSPGILRISLLNRRFRFIALNTPSLWTKVPRIGGEFYDSFIERSKEHLLDVTIKIKKSYSSDEIEELESILSTDAVRWKALTILFPRKNFNQGPDRPTEHSFSFIETLSKFHDLELPSLETFKYSVYGEYSGTTSLPSTCERELCIYEGWETPKLKKMTTEGFHPTHFSSHKNSISDVTIDIDITSRNDDYFSLRKIKEFLKFAPSIESLRFIMTRPKVKESDLNNTLTRTHGNTFISRVPSMDIDDAILPVTHDSLYKCLTGVEDVHILGEYSTGCSGEANPDQYYYVGLQTFWRADNSDLVYLDKLKYLEIDLDQPYNIFYTMETYTYLATLNVEELVFKLNKPRQTERSMPETSPQENGCYAQTVSTIFKDYLFRNTWVNSSGAGMPNLKRLFISIHNSRDGSWERNCTYQVPWHASPNLEHLQISIFCLKPNFNGLENIKLNTLCLSGYPSYVITQSLVKYIENVAMKGSEWHPKHVILNINRCPRSEIYRAVTERLFRRLSTTKFLWNDIKEDMSLE